jgi:hypothetical protein
MPITAGANFKKIITSMKHGSEIAKSRADLITTVWPKIILFFLAVVDGSEGVRGGASKAKIANGGSATIARWLSPARNMAAVLRQGGAVCRGRAGPSEATYG